MKTNHFLRMTGFVLALVASAGLVAAEGEPLPPGTYAVGGGAGSAPGEHLNGYASMSGPGTGQMQVSAAGQTGSTTYDITYDPTTGDHHIWDLQGNYMGEIRVMQANPPTYNVNYYSSNGAYAGSGTWNHHG